MEETSGNARFQPGVESGAVDQASRALPRQILNICSKGNSTASCSTVCSHRCYYFSLAWTESGLWKQAESSPGQSESPRGAWAAEPKGARPADRLRGARAQPSRAGTQTRPLPDVRHGQDRVPDTRTTRNYFSEAL